MDTMEELLESSFADLPTARSLKFNFQTEEQQRMRSLLRSVLAQCRDRVAELFKAWDDDGNGSISPAEFRKAVRGLGFRPSACDATDEDVDRWIGELFVEFDEDRSGSLAVSELERKLSGILTKA